MAEGNYNCVGMGEDRSVGGSSDSTLMKVLGIVLHCEQCEHWTPAMRHRPSKTENKLEWVGRH